MRLMMSASRLLLGIVTWSVPSDASSAYLIKAYLLSLLFGLIVIFGHLANSLNPPGSLFTIFSLFDLLLELSRTVFYCLTTQPLLFDF